MNSARLDYSRIPVMIPVDDSNGAAYMLYSGMSYAGGDKNPQTKSQCKLGDVYNDLRGSVLRLRGLAVLDSYSMALCSAVGPAGGQMLSSGLGGGKLKIKVLYPTHGRDPLRSGPSRDAHRLPGPGCGCISPSRHSAA